MKIATWNLERLIKQKNDVILAKLYSLDADILVLTETSEQIHLEGYTNISTLVLPKGHDGIAYQAGENRVTVWTKYPILSTYYTYDKYTSICVDIDTPFGILTVYGTIIGVFANKQPRFNQDLYSQLEDFKRIFPDKQACLVGDLNIMFSGFAYPSHDARNMINLTCQDNNLRNTTSNLPKNVDQIILSESYIQDAELNLHTWNEDLSLSDHRGICLEIVKHTTN